MAANNIVRLNDLRIGLLHLHKALLDFERENFEYRQGRVAPAQFLQVVLNDPQFAWLRFLSELIVKIDETLDSKEPVPDEDVTAIISEARKLLNPPEINEDFAEKYQTALQKEPAVVIAHQGVRQLLK